MMKKIIVYILTIAAICSCSSDKTGPETVVEAFNKAVSAGNWAEAEKMCDTLSMKKYMDNCKQTWAALQKEDSAAFNIAVSILAETEIKVTDIQKTEDGRVVCYTVNNNTMQKEKKASVRKDEEGEWKVTAITDAI